MDVQGADAVDNVFVERLWRSVKYEDVWPVRRGATKRPPSFRGQRLAGATSVS